MNVQRSDVVHVDFPFPSGLASKVRPALVIQNNRDNDRLPNTVVAQITSTTLRAMEAKQVLKKHHLILKRRGTADAEYRKGLQNGKWKIGNAK